MIEISGVESGVGADGGGGGGGHRVPLAVAELEVVTAGTPVALLEEQAGAGGQHVVRLWAEDARFARCERVDGGDPVLQGGGGGEGWIVVEAAGGEAVVLGVLDAVDGVLKGGGQRFGEVEGEFGDGDDFDVVGIPEGDDGGEEEARFDPALRGGPGAVGENPLDAGDDGKEADFVEEIEGVAGVVDGDGLGGDAVAAGGVRGDAPVGYGVVLEIFP